MLLLQLPFPPPGNQTIASQAVSRIERGPFKKSDLAQSNKQVLADALETKRQIQRELKFADRQTAAALASAKAVAKQREESDLDDTSMLDSDDDQSFPSPASKLLHDTYAKGKRSASVWTLRDNEKPDGEVHFGVDSDDDANL